MARIPDSELDRIKREVDLEALVVASGVKLVREPSFVDYVAARCSATVAPPHPSGAGVIQPDFDRQTPALSRRR